MKQFINTSLLKFIPSTSIKLFLNWYNQCLKQIKCVLAVNGEVKRFTSAQETDIVITKQQTCNENKFIIIYAIYITHIQSSIANFCQKWSQNFYIIIMETILSQCFELIQKITIGRKEGNVLFTVIWRQTIQIAREETRCHHMGYSFRLTVRVLLYAPSHRQESTYHGLCYTSCGALAGTRNSSMRPPHEGSIR